jgi:RNA recognition motif-containing protein
LPVRLFVGNLPFAATEAELREHFSAVGVPSSVLLPVNRETGRPRGFAFVDYADPAAAQEAIRRFDAQPFKGRPLSVSEARPRGAEPPRPSPSHHTGPRPAQPFAPSEVGPRGERSPGFGPPAAPARSRKQTTARRTAKAERAPKRPIRERPGGRFFNVDDIGEHDEVPTDFEDFATRTDEGDEQED